ncbi:hypothetical protein KY345_00450 [Candidatus Woesearchaeota archaeon]|nr:hypothetical protein [Candidatus Woesearchaeota archaeon]
MRNKNPLSRKEKSILSLVIGGCLALMGYGIMSDYYPEYLPEPKANEVRRYSTEAVKANHRISINKRDERAINRILNKLENVPDAFQKKGNEYGGVVVIFDGRITEDKCSAYLGLEQHKEQIKKAGFENTIGTYFPFTGEVFVKQKSRPKGISAVLHEYGHMIDYALVGGWMDFSSNEKEFRRIFDISKKYRDFFFFKRMDNHESSDPREFFAESFARYYFSDKSRKKLRKEFPEAYQYLCDLEKRVVAEN